MLAKHQERGVTMFFNNAEKSLLAADAILAQRPADDKISRGYADALFKAWSAPGTGNLKSWAMGSGKTLTGLYIMAHWRRWQAIVGPRITAPVVRDALNRPHIVVAKANGVHVWREQLQQWFPTAPQDWIVNPTSGREIDAAIASVIDGHSRCLAISYSLLSRYITKIDALRFSLGIFDEVQALTNPTTERAQAIYRLMRLRDDGVPGVMFKIAMSGTPFTNRVTDLWPVLAMLQGYSVPQRRGGVDATDKHYLLRSPIWGSRAEFDGKYTVALGNGKSASRNLIHDPRHNIGCVFHKADECNHLHPRLLRTVMDRVTADEAWPNLPNAVPQWIPVAMGPTQAALYRQLVDDEVVPALSARGANQDFTVQRMALMTYAFEALASTKQLEYSATQKGRAGLRLPPGKRHESGLLKAIVEMADDMDDDEPFIVYTFFSHFAEEIASHPALASRKPLLLTSQSGLKNSDAAKLFQGGKSNLLVSTTKGIEAMTLTRARVLVIAGFLSFSPFDIQQAIYRIRRPGQQSERLMIYCLYHDGTLLEWLRAKLAHKLEYGMQALDGVAGGSNELGLRHMTDMQFVDAFWGRGVGDADTKHNR